MNPGLEAAYECHQDLKNVIIKKIHVRWLKTKALVIQEYINTYSNDQRHFKSLDDTELSEI